MEAGERLYIRITPIGQGGAVVKWDPTFTYQSLDSGPLTAAQQNLREPEGTYIHRFVQSRDFKPVGRVFAPWFAESEGVVRVDGQVVKTATSDDVRIRIVQEHANGSAQTVHFSSPPLSGNETANLSTALTGISVKGGDKLWFEVLSDLPIDPPRSSGDRS